MRKLINVAPYCLALESFAFNYSFPDSAAKNLLLKTNKYGIQITSRFFVMAKRKEIKNRLIWTIQGQ